MHTLLNHSNAHVITKFCNGSTLVDINITSGRYLKKPPKDFEEFKTLLPRKIIGVGQHGNNIFLILDELMVWTTLGLAGKWNTVETENSRITFVLDDGRKIYFEDSRNFGTMTFYNGKYKMLKKLNSLEPDLFSKGLDEAEFKSKLKKYSDVSIAFLLSKKYDGFEILWIEECLYQCQIHPNTKCEDLKAFQINVLVETINDLLTSIKETYDPFKPVLLDFEADYIGNQKEDDEGRIVEVITTDDNVKIKGIKEYV